MKNYPEINTILTNADFRDFKSQFDSNQEAMESARQRGLAFVFFGDKIQVKEYTFKTANMENILEYLETQWEQGQRTFTTLELCATFGYNHGKKVSINRILKSLRTAKVLETAGPAIDNSVCVRFTKSYVLSNLDK